MHNELIITLGQMGIDTECAECAMEEDPFIKELVYAMYHEILALRAKLAE